MGLSKLTERIFFLEHEPKVDRPMLAYINGISIAHDKTNEFLRNQQELAKDTHYIEKLKNEDIHFRKEYCGQEQLHIVLADLSFSDAIALDLGGLTAKIFHTESPHSEDTVCIYVPEEKVFFDSEQKLETEEFICCSIKL